jgi:predicted amidohydrolase YtcJ
MLNCEQHASSCLDQVPQKVLTDSGINFTPNPDRSKLGYGDKGMLTIRSVKLFLDGALGSWGASMLNPYSDEPQKQGLLRIQPDVLNRTVKQV